MGRELMRQGRARQAADDRRRWFREKNECYRNAVLHEHREMCERLSDTAILWMLDHEVGESGEAKGKLVLIVG
jgi:hypothetical protein